MSTLKDLAASAKLVSQDALERAFSELKTYIDTQDSSGSSAASSAIAAVQSQLDALIGATNGDADKLLNTFNDIKAFLSDYDEDDTLKSLLDAIDTAISAEETRAKGVEGNLNTAIGNEVTRAQGAESALSGRVTTLENVNIMTSSEAKTLFDSVFNPTPTQEEQTPQSGGGDEQNSGEQGN